jgi:hypothetical protein
MHMQKQKIRDGPFNFQGGYGFFLKKYSDSQCCWKKYSDFGGGKKNLIQSFAHLNVPIKEQTICLTLESMNKPVSSLNLSMNNLVSCLNLPINKQKTFI